MIINEKQRSIDAIVGCDYVFPGDVSLETLVGINKIAVTLVAGKSWNPLYFTPGSAFLTCGEKMDSQGKNVENKLQLKTPGGSAALVNDLLQICGRSIVIRLTFASGAMLICGGKNRKLRLFDNGTYGTANGHDLSFDYVSKTDFKWSD